MQLLWSLNKKEFMNFEVRHFDWFDWVLIDNGFFPSLRRYLFQSPNNFVSSKESLLFSIFILQEIGERNGKFLSETARLMINQTETKEMVFCYQNCSDLLWEKIVLVFEKNFWNLRLKAENFQNFWDH